MTKTIQKLF